jgi:hypothetical protein
LIDSGSHDGAVNLKEDMYIHIYTLAYALACWTLANQSMKLSIQIFFAIITGGSDLANFHLLGRCFLWAFFVNYRNSTNFRPTFTWWKVMYYLTLAEKGLGDFFTNASEGSFFKLP